MKTTHTTTIVLAGATLLATASVASADARARVLHASPDAPTVDVLVNAGLPAPFEALSFGDLSSYVSVPGGEYDIDVVGTGTTEPSVINVDNLPLLDSTDYTIAASNNFASIAPFVFVDDNTLVADKARLRFIHLGVGAPDVEIFVGDALLVSSTGFGNASGYVEVDAGTYDLTVRVAGTTDVALQLDGVTVDANTVYTAFALGDFAADPANLFASLSVDAVPAPGAAASLAMFGLAAARRRRSA